MTKKTDKNSAVILRNLVLLLPCFFAMYYVIVVILSAACGRPSFDPLVPFDFNHFGPHLDSHALVTWLSLIVAYVLLPVLYFFLVQNTHMADDYTFTVCFVHGIISCGVMGGFPFFYDFVGGQGTDYAWSNGVWFLTLAVMGWLSTSVQELAVLYLHDMITSIQTHP
jgi:hypothetical protein